MGLLGNVTLHPIISAKFLQKYNHPLVKCGVVRDVTSKHLYEVLQKYNHTLVKRGVIRDLASNYLCEVFTKIQPLTRSKRFCSQHSPKISTKYYNNKTASLVSASVIGIITDALVIFAYRQVILLSQLYFATQSYIYP